MGSGEQWRKEGKYLFARGKYDEAIKLLNRSIQKDPEDAEALLFKGRSLFYLKKYGESIKCYQRVVQTGSLQQDANSGIIQCCKSLLQINKRNAEALDLMVSSLIALGREDEALTICEADKDQGLKFCPALWNWRGRALYAAGSYEDAIKYFDKTLHLEPGNVEALIGKGRSLYMLKRPSDALECFDAATLQTDQNSKAWALKGAALNALYRHQEAADAMSRAKALGYKP